MYMSDCPPRPFLGPQVRVTESSRESHSGNLDVLALPFHFTDASSIPSFEKPYPYSALCILVLHKSTCPHFLLVTLAGSPQHWVCLVLPFALHHSTRYWLTYQYMSTRHRGPGKIVSSSIRSRGMHIPSQGLRLVACFHL